jgi:hypothetical protein
MKGLSVKKQKGSIVICLLTLLAVILPFCFVVVLLTSALSVDQQMKKICRDQLIQAEQKSAVTLVTLLKLNPTATLLRLKKQQTEIALAAAIASANKPLVLKMMAQLKQIHSQRLKLDQLQKNLLQRQSISNRLAIQTTQMQLQRFLNQNIKDAVFLHTINFTQSKSIGLAVQPDIPDIAPVYETVSDFEDQQTLSVYWKWALQAAQPSLKKYRLSLLRECSVTLTKGMMQWKPLLKTDRSLLRD